ncbi:hypothetical protein, partial [Serratia marcescens]|uniref:hypothetical protein n=1 Tax=Serratia marcescens TaxID=615 RepID=UPI001954F152
RPDRPAHDACDIRGPRGAVRAGQHPGAALFGDSAAGQTIYVVVGFGLLGLSYGQTAGAVASNFGTHYRYTGSALT